MIATIDQTVSKAMIIRNKLRQIQQYLCIQLLKALDAGANVLDRKIGPPCSSPVEVATYLADLFYFDAYNEGGPGGAGCHL